MAMSPSRSWATLYQDLLDASNRTVASDGDRVKRSICEAAAFLDGDEGPWFSQGRFSFLLTAEQGNYAPGEGAGGAYTGVPGDLMEWQGNLVLQLEGNPASEYVIRWVTVPYLQEDGPFQHEDLLDVSTPTGRPTAAAWWNEELILRPVPDTSGDVVRGRYLRRLGAPFYAHTGSAWAFYKPNGEAIADGYPDPTKGEANGWFADGYQVLYQRSLYVFQAKYLKAPEDANTAMLGYLEELEKLRIRTEGRTHRAGFVRPFLPGLESSGTQRGMA